MSHLARNSLKFASRQLIMQCDKLLLFFSYISTPKGQQITQKISVKIIKYLSFGDGKLKLKKKKSFWKHNEFKNRIISDFRL